MLNNQYYQYRQTNNNIENLHVYISKCSCVGHINLSEFHIIFHSSFPVLSLLSLLFSVTLSHLTELPSLTLPSLLSSRQLSISTRSIFLLFTFTINHFSINSKESAWVKVRDLIIVKFTINVKRNLSLSLLQVIKYRD